MVNIWELSTATVVAAIPTLEYSILSVSFSCDGAYLAVAQEKGPVGLFASPSGRPAGSIGVGSSHSVAWNPKHARVLAYTSDDAAVWNAEGRHTDAGGPIGIAVFGGGGGGGGSGGGGGRGR
jgi:WD40 repeat protein